MKLLVLFGILGVAGAQVISAEDGSDITATAENDPNREVEEPADEEGEMNKGEEGDAFSSDGTVGASGGDWGDDDRHRTCSEKDRCDEGEGDCDRNSQCSGENVCKMNACKKQYNKKGRNWKEWADCCGPVGPFDWDYCRLKHNGPCDEGEGDCDSHKECGPGLKCGVNNCRNMHPNVPAEEMNKKLDCCTRCSEVRVGPSGMLQKMEAEYFDANKEVAGSERTLVKPPSVLVPAAVWNLPSLGDGDEIKLSCCSHKGSKCEFFVSVYLCKPCSDDLNGGLPATLMGMGWSAGSCAPRFELPMDSGNSHSMLTFHMTLYAGDKVVIPINKDAPHVAVFERPGKIAQPWCPKVVGPQPPSGPHPPGAECKCIPTKK